MLPASGWRTVTTLNPSPSLPFALPVVHVAEYAERSGLPPVGGLVPLVHESRIDGAHTVNARSGLDVNGDASSVVGLEVREVFGVVLVDSVEIPGGWEGCATTPASAWAACAPAPASAFAACDPAPVSAWAPDPLPRP